MSYEVLTSRKISEKYHDLTAGQHIQSSELRQIISVC